MRFNAWVIIIIIIITVIHPQRRSQYVTGIMKGFSNDGYCMGGRGLDKVVIG